MTVPRLDFYFDYRSPYAYLAQTQVRHLGKEVSYRPFDIVRLMDEVGNVPTSVICKPKTRYIGADLQRWAGHYGVPLLRRPDFATIDARRLLRATLAAEALAGGAQAVAAIFDAFWAAGAPLATAADIAGVLERAGVTAADLAGRIDDPALDQALDRATAAAATRGVFGAPTMFVGDEMFFGNDRLEFVRASLEVAA